MRKWREREWGNGEMGRNGERFTPFPFLLFLILSMFSLSPFSHSKCYMGRRVPGPLSMSTGKKTNYLMPHTLGFRVNFVISFVEVFSLRPPGGGGTMANDVEIRESLRITI